MSPTSTPAALEQLADRRHRADAHHARVDACDRAADERPERLGAEGLRPLLARDHERGGAVVDPARVPGRDRTVRAERRLQCRELLGARVRTRMLVANGVADRHELVVEAPRLGGLGPALLRAERELVLLLAADAVALGHVLAGLAHRLERKHRLHLRIREPPAERRVPDGLVPARPGRVRLGHDERRTAHRLDATGHEQVAVPRRDRMAGGDDCRQPGRAEPVHGHARDRVGQAREQDAHARHVPVVLAGLVRGAEVDVLDLARAHARARHGLLDHDRREIVGPLACEHAPVAPDGRAHRGENDRAAHAAAGRGRRTSSPPQFGQT